MGLGRVRNLEMKSCRFCGIGFGPGVGGEGEGEVEFSGEFLRLFGVNGSGPF